MTRDGQEELLYQQGHFELYKATVRLLRASTFRQNYSLITSVEQLNAGEVGGSDPADCGSAGKS